MRFNQYCEEEQDVHGVVDGEGANEKFPFDDQQQEGQQVAPTQMVAPSFPLKSNHSTVLAPAVALATLNSPMTIKANTNPAVSQSMRCDMGLFSSQRQFWRGVSG